MTRGTKVRITADGRVVAGEIVIASDNDRSLLVSFEALLCGHLGMAALLQRDDGQYYSIINGEAFGIEVMQ